MRVRVDHLAAALGTASLLAGCGTDPSPPSGDPASEATSSGDPTRGSDASTQGTSSTPSSTSDASLDPSSDATGASSGGVDTSSSAGSTEAATGADHMIFLQEDFDESVDTQTAGPLPPAGGWQQWMGAAGESSTHDGVTHYSGEVTAPGRGGAGKSLKLWRYGGDFHGYTGSLVTTLATGANTIFVRWYLRIPVEMDIVANVHFQKLWRFNTSNPDSEIYLNINGSGSSMRDTGALSMLAGGGPWTDMIPPGSLATTIWDGQWHCLEFELGLASSMLAFWLDGELQFESSEHDWHGATGATFDNLLQHFPLGNRAGDPLSTYQAS